MRLILKLGFRIHLVFQYGLRSVVKPSPDVSSMAKATYGSTLTGAPKKEIFSIRPCSVELIVVFSSSGSRLAAWEAEGWAYYWTPPALWKPPEFHTELQDSISRIDLGFFFLFPFRFWVLVFCFGLEFAGDLLQCTREYHLFWSVKYVNFSSLKDSMDFLLRRDDRFIINISIVKGEPLLLEKQTNSNWPIQYLSNKWINLLINEKGVYS